MLKSQITMFLIVILLLLLWLKKLLASCPVVDTAVLFIRCRCEELGQFLDTGRPYASTRLFLNVL